MPTIPTPPRKTFLLERSIEIDCPAEKLFRFHRDTRNAPKVSPGTHFISIDGEFPLDEGDVFTIRFQQQPLPLVLTWTFVVESVVLNAAVIDVALRSPFAYWRHEHRFETLDRGRTRLTDRVRYAMPMGPLGRMAHSMFVRGRLERMFEQRQTLTKRLMER